MSTKFSNEKFPGGKGENQAFLRKMSTAVTKGENPALSKDLSKEVAKGENPALSKGLSK